MGYYDEDFGSHLWFAVKFFLFLCLLRVGAYYLGYTGHVPVIDDFGDLMMSIGKSAAAAAEQLFGIRI